MKKQKITPAIDGAPEGYVTLDTFTGEKVWYNAEKHRYLSLEGKKLMSASRYAESLEEQFPLEVIAKKVADKIGVGVDHVKDMWARNGEISRTFGNALHLAMEQFFLHRNHGGPKQYHLPKPTYLRRAVETFPWASANLVPEVVLSDVKRGMVGRTDGLVVDETAKTVDIVDFKSDANVSDNLGRHAYQLNFYRVMVENAGWKVSSMVIWNYVDSWAMFPLPIRAVNLP